LAYKVEVDGADVTQYLAEEPSLEVPYNERAVSTFRMNPGPSLPDRGDAVVIYDSDGTTKLFVGVVGNRRVRGLVETDANLCIDITAVDKAFYTDGAFITRSEVGETSLLSDVLPALIAALPGGAGITLHGAQADATVPPYTWENRSVKEALDEVGEWLGGWIWRIDTDSKLRMIAPGSISAPVSMTDGSPNCRSFVWSDVTDPPTDQVILVGGANYAGSGVLVGKDLVADGVQTTFVGDIDADESSDGGAIDLLLINGTPTDPNVSPYSWNPSTKTLTKTGSPLTVGTTVYFQYPGVFPFTVTRDDGSPSFTARFEEPNTIVYAQAVASAEALLAQLDVERKEATIVTETAGFAPGQALAINLTSRGLNETHIVRTVRTHFLGTAKWYTLTTLSEAA